MAEKNELCLITTSHPDFWDLDGPAVLLGQWCMNGRRAAEVSGSDVRIARPYGFAIEDRDRDHALVRSLEERLFVEFCLALNAHHRVSHSQRYWRILVGQWFRTAIGVIFNRTRTLRQCLDEHTPAWTVEPVGEKVCLATRLSNDSLWAYSDPKWDGHFCLQILKLIAPGTTLKFKPPTARPTNAADPKLTPIPGPDPKKRLLLVAWRVCQNIAQRFVRKDDALIINSYLPRLDEVRLQLRLGQVPQLWKSPPIRFEQPVDFGLRRQLAATLRKDGVEEVEAVVRELLFELVPLCYLEGYQHLKAQVRLMPWPKKPKLILTSNNFGTDEIFKAWTAERTAEGTPYVVGQHGNNYGTHRYMNPSIEEMTSDAFISWGWNGRLPQHRAGFNLKIPAATRLRADPRGGLLLVEVWAGHRTATWDVAEQFMHYLSDQFEFVKGIGAEAKSQLKVRLHHDWARLDWNEPARWREFDPQVRLDPGFESIRDQIGKSRLVIHSYDSTGLLETLALDIPTLAFWQNGLSHLRDEVKHDFQALVDVGIVHLSPQSAARAVNTIWDDVDSWWAVPARQEAVRKFCRKYARLSAEPARDLKTLLDAALGERPCSSHL